MDQIVSRTMPSGVKVDRRIQLLITILAGIATVGQGIVIANGENGSLRWFLFALFGLTFILSSIGSYKNHIS